MRTLSSFKKIGAFLLPFILCSMLIAFAVANKNHMEELTMEQLLIAKSTRVSETISRLAYYRVRMLSTIVLQGNGYVEDFELLATTILDDSAILYVLLAPGGIVSNVYPLPGNESLLNMNILADGIGVREAVMAKESGQIVLGGPFDMSGGGQALLARLPVYMDKQDGSKEFWGLVSVAIKYPQVMDIIGLDELEMQGFAYEIYKVNPDTSEKKMIANCQYHPSEHTRVLEKQIDIFNDKWHFRIFSVNSWYKDIYLGILIFISIALSFLVTRLQVMTMKASEASKAKSDFLASMSHEIRTPMNAIIGMSELLIQEKLTGRQQEYVNDIKTSSTSLLGIINDILDVSKIEAGKLTIAPVYFNLPEFIENVHSIMSFAAKSKNLEFILEVAEPIPKVVYGDDVRLRQILINLLGNAVKFTETGSVKLGVSYAEGNACFIISDTGVGIKESDMGKLYDSFEQFDSKKNRGKQGTGLGLFITKSLVNMLGGKIDVSSIYGVGTTFNMDIPLTLNAENQIDDNTSAVEFISAKGANVLLVDDNEINRKVASGLLKLNGIDCDVAENGIEAIQKVQEKDYDIVFMDHMMPEMDGAEATVKIREMGGKYKKDSLIIIALTANLLPEAKELFEVSGMNDFLGKPIDKVLLNKLLAKWLPEEKQIKSAQPKSLFKEIPESDYSPVLKSACSIEGLDVALGLSRVSSMEDYERSLRLLSGSIPRLGGDLERFLENGELDRFAIDVHGLKGALAINGNMDLSEMAQKLETESKNKNLEFCKSHFPDFLIKLTLLGSAIDKIFQQIEAKPKLEGSNDILLQTLANIESAVDCYDRDSALKELAEISDYSFGDDIDKKLEQLTVALENFDFDIAAELMQSIDL